MINYTPTKNKREIIFNNFELFTSSDVYWNF